MRFGLTFVYAESEFTRCPVFATQRNDSVAFAEHSTLRQEKSGQGLFLFRAQAQGTQLRIAVRIGVAAAVVELDYFLQGGHASVMHVRRRADDFAQGGSLEGTAVVAREAAVDAYLLRPYQQIPKRTSGWISMASCGNGFLDPNGLKLVKLQEYRQWLPTDSPGDVGGMWGSL